MLFYNHAHRGSTCDVQLGIGGDHGLLLWAVWIWHDVIQQCTNMSLSLVACLCISDCHVWDCEIYQSSLFVSLQIFLHTMLQYHLQIWPEKKLNGTTLLDKKQMVHYKKKQLWNPFSDAVGINDCDIQSVFIHILFCHVCRVGVNRRDIIDDDRKMYSVHISALRSH